MKQTVQKKKINTIKVIRNTKHRVYYKIKCFDGIIEIKYSKRFQLSEIAYLSTTKSIPCYISEVAEKLFLASRILIGDFGIYNSQDYLAHIGAQIIR